MSVTRARACVGARFRLHGRDPATGLDCVVLAAFALAAPEVPSGYALRSGDATAVRGLLLKAGLCATADWRPGALLLCDSGPGQLHLAIWTGDGIVHACARARRVVERPGLPPWPVLSAWRKEKRWQP